MLKKTGLAVLIIVFVFLLLYAGIYVYLKLQVTTQLENEIENFWIDQYGCSCIVEVGHIGVSPFFNKISIEAVEVRVEDVNSCQKLSEGGVMVLGQLKSAKFEISNPFWFLNKEHPVHLNRVSFSGVDLNVFLGSQDNGEDEINLEEVELNGLDDFIINEFELKDFSVKVFEFSEPDEPIADVKDLNFKIKLEYEEGKEKVVDLHMLTRDVEFSKTDGIYLFKLRALKISEAGDRIIFEDFRVIPLLDKVEFNEQLEYQDDHFSMSYDSIVIFDMDMFRLMHERSFNCGKISVHGMQAEVFRDKNPPFDKSQRPDMPIQLLQNLPVKVGIDSLVLDHAVITYEELAKNGEVPGFITFNQLNATIYHISNQVEESTQNTELKIVADARVYDEMPIHATFLYDLVDTTGKYSVTGHVGKGSLISINQMLEPLSGILIDKGTHEQTHFSLYGDNFSTEGMIEMYYDDLLFEISRERMKGFVYFKRVLARFGNRFALNSSNPDRNGEFQKGEVYFERDQSRFVFHYWWNSFFTGIRSTMVSINPTLKEFFPEYDFERIEGK